MNDYLNIRFIEKEENIVPSGKKGNLFYTNRKFPFDAFFNPTPDGNNLSRRRGGDSGQGVFRVLRRN